MPVKFSYLYRDAGNYKAWGEVVFGNPENIPLNELDARLRKPFEVDGLFVAHQVSIPEVFLYLSGELTDDDHCYHEFFSLELTDEKPNDHLGRSIKQFVEQVEEESNLGWTAFHPAERILKTKVSASRG